MKTLVPFFVSALKATVLSVREDAPAAGTVSPPAAPAGGKSNEQLIQEGIDAAVRGLKAKNEELLGKNKEYKTKLEALELDEDMKLFSEGKKAVVIDKYTERMRSSHATELETERLRTLEETTRANNYRGAVLDNQIRSVTSDLHKSAVDDALLHARQIFTLDAKGNAVKVDAEGRPELGKDGKTPFSPAEWMEMQRELKPHWFPASTSGSGSTGAQGSGSGTGKTMKRGEFNALSGVQQANVARSGTRIVD